MSEAITQAAAYELIDRFLRSNLHDDDYAEYSNALEAIYHPAPSPQPAVPVVSDERLLHEWDRVSRIAKAGSRRLAFARAILALRPAVDAMTWPKGRDVGRYGDMSPGQHLRVGLDSDNDVYVSVWDEDGGASVEFCNPGGGGGGSSRRTREALIALMVAIEADNAERPEKDWWARRNGITTKAEGGA